MQQLGLQQAKSLRARTAICEATIQLLVDVGYADTSLNRVAAAAGFSKGALQHHFRSKEDLIAATVNMLLERTFVPGKREPETVEEALMGAWKRFINTPAYQAMMEILSVSRRDPALRERISDDLHAWGRRLDEQSIYQYEAVSGDDSDAKMILNMTRSYMRGLLLQESYGFSEAETERHVKKWIELVAPQLRLRNRGNTDE